MDKGTIEISMYERDANGKPTNRKRNFSSQKAEEVRDFWHNNRQQIVKKTRKVNSGNIRQENSI